MTAHAIAIDLGATSIRFAHGTFDGQGIQFQIIEQRPNVPIGTSERPCWDFEAILRFCEEACDYAKSVSPDATVGIDSWGVDHGFLDPADSRKLLQPSVCYRHSAHQEVFEELAVHRSRLFELTGIAHQPFNTLYQLVARRREDPSLATRGARWLILPDLLNCFLGATPNYELTQASTTQLMGLDGKWSEEAFAIAGWPPPEVQPAPPGRILGKTVSGVRIVSVGSHDTASAVCGLGTLEPDEAFLNVGTWSLLGCMLDSPLISPEGEKTNFSNEWAVDGRIRYLRNTPGFYVVNRLHEELEVSGSVPDWIDRADRSCPERIDLLAPELFNPASMRSAVRAQLQSDPPTVEAWSGIALMSLAEGTAQLLSKLEAIVDRRFTSLRLSGGGSNSRAFCESLSNASGCTVLAGPAEATVLGNLGAQFLAQGHFKSWQELGDMLRRSQSLRVYAPSK